MHEVTDTAPRYARSTLAAAARRSLVKGAAWFLILGTALWAASLTHNLNVRFTPNTQEVVVQSMLTEHGCWQGFAPEGAEAHHVVVTKVGADRPTYGGQRLTDRALQQVLFDGPYVGQVHGFCR